MIKAGSFSRLDVFETCKRRAHIAFVQRVKEPVRPPLPNGKEYPNDRGERVHNELDAYVKGDSTKFPSEAEEFREEVEKIRALHQEGRVSAEQMWCYDDAWVPVADDDWNNTAMRIKTDVTVFAEPDHVIIVDYKTGRRYGNELKHAQQLQLYGIGAAMRYEKVNYITAELWYLDQEELVSQHFERRHAVRLLAAWNTRLQKMFEERKFPATPSRENCKWCPYGPRGTGHCKDGV
jgi:CRISPR/Cas system-associated exonuclease Cas4 (RecB family)